MVKKDEADQALLRISQLQGPYQTPFKMAQTAQKEAVVRKDALRQTLDATRLFPEVIANLIAGYFFYQQAQKTTVHLEKEAEKIISSLLESLNKPSYSFNLTHAYESHIQGDELITSLEQASILPRDCFILQEWAYKKPGEEEDRCAEGRVVEPSKIYSLSEFKRFVFGMDIASSKEWTIRELLAYQSRQRSKAERPKAKRLKRSPSECIIC